MIKHKQEKYRWHLFLAILGCILALHSQSPSAWAIQKAERKKIVVLISFRPTLPVAVQWDKGLRSILEADPSKQYVVNIEHLDLAHYGDEKHLSLLTELLRYKYADHQPDLIIPVMDAATGLVLDYGRGLFPNVPIVFGGVEESFIEGRTLPDNVTGYLAGISYKGVLDVALRIHPDTLHIYVVGGASLIVKNFVKNSRSVYREYEDDYKINYLIGLPMQDLLARVGSLPPRSIIINLPVLRDGNGQEFISNEAFAMISEAASAPVYTFWDICLGTGVVGGYVGSFEKEAEAVARLGVRVLEGESPSSIPVSQAPKFVNMFDWKQLKRWRISEDLLPEESIIINREVTAWEEYWKQITTVLVLTLLQYLMILYLIHQRRSRFKAEHELSSKSAETEQLQMDLAHLGRVVTINTLTSALAHEINQPLAAIRSYAQAALRFMDTEDPSKENLKIALQGIVSDNKRAADVVNRLRNLVKRSEPIKESFDIHTTIQEVIALLNSEIIMRDANISLDLSSAVSVVYADSVHVQQVLLNLLINALDAVKDKPSGSRIIKVATTGTSDEMIVTVADSGNGISSNESDLIFEAFHTTKPEGMGLGLAICRTLVESHKGKIWVEPGNDGAVFTFTLPTNERSQVA